MLKKFFIVASMICVLVSSLVVVSFADEVDESKKYNYERYVEYSFVDLTSSSRADITGPIYGSVQDVMVVVEFFDNTKTHAVGASIISSYARTDSLDKYIYQINDDQGYMYCQWGFTYDIDSGVFNDSFFVVSGESQYTADIVKFTIYYNGSIEFDRVENSFMTVTNGLVENPSSPSYLLSLLFTGFGFAIGGLALGVKESLSNVIWVDPTATNKVLSPLVTFIFTIAGLSIAMTVFFLIFRLIRFGRQR